MNDQEPIETNELECVMLKKDGEIERIANGKLERGDSIPQTGDRYILVRVTASSGGTPIRLISRRLGICSSKRSKSRGSSEAGADSTDVSGSTRSVSPASRAFASLHTT